MIAMTPESTTSAPGSRREPRPRAPRLPRRLGALVALAAAAALTTSCMIEIETRKVPLRPQEEAVATDRPHRDVGLASLPMEPTLQAATGLATDAPVS